MYILVHRQKCIQVLIKFVCLTSLEDGSLYIARSRRALINRQLDLYLCVVEAGCYGDVHIKPIQGARALLKA
jgi:hypothetical protein